MKQYIDREAVLQKRLLWIENNKRSVPVVMVEDIDTIPAADVAKVRHGWWISVEADVRFRCSLCDCEVSTSWDYEQDGMFDYCPCCGAKMDGGVNDADG